MIIIPYANRNIHNERRCYLKTSIIHHFFDAEAVGIVVSVSCTSRATFAGSLPSTSCYVRELVIYLHHYLYHTPTHTQRRTPPAHFFQISRLGRLSECISSFPQQLPRRKICHVPIRSFPDLGGCAIRAGWSSLCTLVSRGCCFTAFPEFYATYRVVCTKH